MNPTHTRGESPSLILGDFLVPQGKMALSFDVGLHTLVRPIPRPNPFWTLSCTETTHSPASIVLCLVKSSLGCRVLVILPTLAPKIGMKPALCQSSREMTLAALASLIDPTFPLSRYFLLGPCVLVNLKFVPLQEMIYPLNRQSACNLCLAGIEASTLIA